MKAHLKDDIDHLNSGNYTNLYVDEILNGIEKTRNSLKDFAAGMYILLS